MDKQVRIPLTGRIDSTNAPDVEKQILDELAGVAPDVPVGTLPVRLTRWKGQTILLDALARMRHRELGCLIVGSDQGRTDYSAELKAMAARLPPETKVVFLEHADDLLDEVLLHHLVGFQPVLDLVVDVGPKVLEALEDLSFKYLRRAEGT